ncbi:hypothetical protein BH18VER1_BH18VER1_06970 [soil metagenome]
MRTGWKSSLCLDTLAAAYAETGDFVQAVKYVKEALAQEQLSPEWRKSIESRLPLYESGKPYRQIESPPSRIAGFAPAFPAQPKGPCTNKPSAWCLKGTLLDCFRRKDAQAVPKLDSSKYEDLF